MSLHTRLMALQKLSALMGVAGASVLISFPAWSQSAPAAIPSGETPTQIAQDSTPASGSEIELSPEGLEILCERFPLNSRCAGAAESGNLTPRPSSGSLDTAPPSSNDSVSPGSDQIPPGGSINPGDSTTPPYGRPDGGLTTPNTTPAPSSPSGETPSGGITEPGGLTSPSERPGSGTTSPNTPSPGSGSSGSGTSPRNVAPKSQLKQDSSGGSGDTTPQTQPSATEAPTTEMPMNGATPGTSTDASEPDRADISETELQQFANVVPKLQEIERSAQQQLSQAIEEAGITQQRFNELYSEQRSPNVPSPAPGITPEATTPATPATPEEQESFNQVLAQIQTINQQIQTQKIDVLESEGLQPQQFNRILAAVQQDPALQQQVQQLLNN